jgi:hypothetical protein
VEAVEEHAGRLRCSRLRGKRPVLTEGFSGCG